MSPVLIRIAAVACLAIVMIAEAGRLGADDAGRRPAPDLEGLRSRIAAVVGAPRFAGATWGISVVSLESGATIFATNAARPLIPASNVKLFTAALALDRLGPEHRVRTSLLAAGLPDAAGSLHGDLTVYGRGDPTFVAGIPGSPWERAVASLADRAIAAGIRRIEGDLVADESYFRGLTVPPGWDPEDLPYAYAAPVSALSLNDNSVALDVTPGPAVGQPAGLNATPALDFAIPRNRVRTGASTDEVRVTFGRDDAFTLWAGGTIPAGAARVREKLSMPQPARWFGETLRMALQRRGVTVKGGVQTKSAVAAGAAVESPRSELGFVESPPLRAMLAPMLKSSQNLHAELLLRQVGARESLAGAPTSEAVALVAMRDLCRRAGIGTAGTVLVDGSGLSRGNRLTADALVALLRYMDRHPQAAVFREGLPLAGIDGTLTKRFVGTAAERNVRAKTGYLTGVAALSGYLTTAAGERLAFAVLLNDPAPPPGSRSAREELDEMVVRLAEISWRGPS